MARTFNGSNQYIRSNWSVSNVHPVTLAAWFNTTDVSTTQTILWFGDKIKSNNFFALDAIGNAAGDPIRFFVRADNAVSASTTTGYTSGAWHHACGVSANATDHRAFIDGGSKGTSSDSSVPFGTDSLCVGRSDDSSPGNYFTGSVAEAAIWEVALSDEEVALLAKGLSPLLIRPESLIFYTPLIRDNDRDLIEGLTMTPVNSPTVDDHPRIIYPSAQILSFEAAEAGGGTTVSATTDALILSENPATLDFSLTITSSVDALVITGNASTISFAKTVTATTDSLSLTENQATLSFSLTVSSTLDSLVIAENQSTVSTALLVTNTVESLTLTENQATLDFTLTITGSSDSLALTENNASIQVGGAITTSTDSLLLVENAATLDFSLTVTGSTDSLTLTENQSTVSFNVTITSSTDSLSLTENSATVDTQLTVSNTLDTLVIAANDATVTTSAAITAGTVALVITENQGTIDTQLTVVSTTEELTIASNDAEIFTTAGQYILGFSSTITSVPMVYVLARTGDNMYVFRHVEDGGTEEIINTGIVASGTDTLLIDVTTDNPKLYIDGALVATSSLSMASTSVSYHGAGALIQSSVTSHMTGRIWNIAYTDPNDGTNSALFPVDEGTGSTLTDSLNGDTATVINFDADMWV